MSLFPAPQNSSAEDESDLQESSEDSSNDEDIEDESTIPERIPSVKAMRIQFDIIGNELIIKGRQKFTVYTIFVLEKSKLDPDQARIERRYNQFLQLHKGLRKECQMLMKDIPFPKKKFFSKRFKGEIVEDRTRLFSKYLHYIYHQEEITKTKAFHRFFFEPHLEEATQYLKCEEYNKSYDGYRLAYQLQRKLGSNKQHLITSMCGIVETSKNLKEYKRAEEIGENCLNTMLYDISNPFLFGLLQAMIDAKRRLEKPTEGMKAKLTECLRKCSKDQDNIQTLREILVKKY